MGRFAIIGEDLESLREELNVVLKKISEEIRVARGEAGDITQGSRMINSDDLIFNTTDKGVVLKDDGTPPQYWRLWVNSSGTLYTESIGGSY